MTIAEHLISDLRDNLTGNILPFWIDRMTDTQRGGFLGRISGEGTPEPDAPKGAILNGRLLWTFSAAYRVLRDPQYLSAATRAYEYLRDHFIDREMGGVYWSVDAAGHPLDTKKQTYAIGFAIYGLSEYRRATGSEEALELAVALFRELESRARDCAANGGGYIEAFTRDWKEIFDMRLSDKDANEKKTMNTHLHVLEPYTNLYRVWPDASLRESIVDLLRVFLDVMEDKATAHLGLFFDEQWNRQDSNISYGHDIEASWLLLEAAGVLRANPGDASGQEMEALMRRQNATVWPSPTPPSKAVQTKDGWHMSDSATDVSTSNATGGCRPRMLSAWCIFTATTGWIWP